jgi:hypothetical protein
MRSAGETGQPLNVGNADEAISHSWLIKAKVRDAKLGRSLSRLYELILRIDLQVRMQDRYLIFEVDQQRGMA